MPEWTEDGVRQVLARLRDGQLGMSRALPKEEIRVILDKLLKNRKLDIPTLERVLVELEKLLTSPNAQELVGDMIVAKEILETYLQVLKKAGGENQSSVEVLKKASDENQSSADVEKLLRDLRWAFPMDVRKSAVEQLGRIGRRDARVLTALQTAAQSDLSADVRHVAGEALRSLESEK